MKIALIGDSHTQITFDQLIPVLESFGQTVVGRISKPGWSVKSYNSNPQFIEDALVNDPDLVIVSLGGNNFQLNGDKYAPMVSEFLQRIGYPKRNVIWLGPLFAMRNDVNERHEWTNQWLKDNLPRNIRYIDLYPYSMLGHGSDGVHFTRSAYQSIVTNISGKIERLLKLQQAFNVAQVVIPVALAIGFGVYFFKIRR